MNPFLNKWKKRGKEVFSLESCKTIGLIGTHSGAGTTYAGFVLALSLSQAIGKKTAYLELSGRNDFCYLKNIWAKKEKTPSVYTERLVFYQQVKETNLGEILNRDYDFILMDFGSQYQKMKNEWLRCDQKIILCSLTPWKKHFLDEFIQYSSNLPNWNRWNYFTLSGGKQEKNEIKKEYKIKISNFPYIPDPFFYSGDMEHIFGSIL